jgi:hypothetical protein
MTKNADPAKPLTNLKTYAERMGITRQAVHYQLGKGLCLVAPIPNTKPPKWRTADIDAFIAGREPDTGTPLLDYAGIKL